MNTEAKKDWRDIVHAHLQAHREDVRRHLESGLSGSEAQFLSKYGTPSVKQGHDRTAIARCDSLGQPPPKVFYEVIEESVNRVLAQVRRPDCVSPHELPVPFWTIRYLLTEEGAGWKIAGIYQPCVFCNHSAIKEAGLQRKDGKCFYCEGKGTDRFGEVRVRGFWIFKRRVFLTQPCKRCGGTGNCPKCAEEEMPGWRSVFSVDS